MFYNVSLFYNVSFNGNKTQHFDFPLSDVCQLDLNTYEELVEGI